MKHWLRNILILTLWLECKGADKVNQPPEDVIATEGQTVTLGCTFETTDLSPTLFWYKQEVNDFPKYVLQRLSGGGGNAAEFPNDRFDATLNKSSVPLKIQKLQLSDSAVYYCAVKPAQTGGNNKITFGEGTKLTVETKVESKPSYFRLTDDDPDYTTNIGSWCLAAGFSNSTMTNTGNNSVLFSDTKPVRIHKDSLYNEVAQMRDDDNNNNLCMSKGDAKCEETLEPDEKVNFMSLTILGLRLLFAKTVVFNVLMTLKLWMSQ